MLAKKRVKKNKGTYIDDYAGVDRLSELPDEILLQVLSFIETKDAINICALSNRLRNLWKVVPVLDFNSYSFTKLDAFNNFVRIVLRSRDRNNSPVSTFRFSCDHRIFGYSDQDFENCVVFVNSVVSHVICHYNVTHLGIWVASLKTRSFEFTSKVFEHENLETLQLSRSCFEFTAPFRFTKCGSLDLRYCFINRKSAGTDVLSCFPNLNNLCLSVCFLYVGSGRFDMLSGCPNLKNLCLRSCVLGPKLKVFKISSPELLSLTIDDLSDNGGLGESCNCKVEISAPKVTFFRYSRTATLDILVIDLPSIQHAVLDFSLSWLSNPVWRPRMQKLFEGISNVQSLVLSSSTIKALAKVPGLEHLPTPFSRLKWWKLKQDGRKNVSFQVLAKVSTYLGCEVSYSWDV